MKAIMAMWTRQMKRYTRNRSRIIGSLGQPLLFLITFGLGLRPAFRHFGFDYIQFIAPGIALLSVVSSAMFFGVELIFDRQFGFLKETLVAPVERWKIVVGRTAGGATAATIQGLIVVFMSMFFGFSFPSLLSFIISVAVMFLIAFAMTAVGTSMATQMRDFHGFQLIMNFVVMPLVFLSGAFFPPSGIPKGLEIAMIADPITYGLDLIRHALLSGYYPLYLDLGITVLLALVAVLAGTILFENMEV